MMFKLKTKLKMKSKLLLLIFVGFAITSIAVAQESEEEMQTLFGEGKITFGGYGGPRVSYSSFDGRDIWLVGGRGGAIINHCFVIGGAGYGIVNSPMYSNYVYEEVNNPKAYLQGGYGGLLIEGIFWPRKLIHFSVPVLIGAGGLQFMDQLYPDGHNDYNDHIIVSSAFFVVEPGIELELNVVKFMRFTAGVSYRYAPKVDLPNIASNAFNSLNASVSFKFGKF